MIAVVETILHRLVPAPVGVSNPGGSSPFLLIGDHAGDAIPEALGDLGLEEKDRSRHVALDIGIKGLGELLAERLDATFIHQHYSRLVIDCNRDPQADRAIVQQSDGTPVPGNVGLSAAARLSRVEEVHAPYQAAIAAEIERRENPILVSLHSFTPVMDGFARPWHAGILHAGGNARLALALLDVLQAMPGLIVGDNEPYRMDETDYTVPFHAYGRRLPYVEIEIRQDLLQDSAGQAEWAGRLADALKQAQALFAAED